jgi:hypothetical protein
MDSLSSILRPSMYGLVWIHVEIKWLMLVILFKFRYPMSPQKKNYMTPMFPGKPFAGLGWPRCIWARGVFHKAADSAKQKKTDLRLCAWLIWMVEACLRLNYRHL